MSKSIKWILAISLILNVLFVGIEIGRFTHQLPPRGFDPIGSENLKKLPPEKRKQYEAMMDSIDSEKQKTFPKMDAIRKEIIAILEAPEFDEVTYKEKFKEMGAIFTADKARMVEETANLAKQFTQEERSLLAERLKQMPPPPHRSRK